MSDKTCLSPAEREALKSEIFSSLHCALPGTVVSFDASTQTAEIRPAVKAGSLVYPMLADVPVFFPGSRECAITWPVSEGDECLLILADVDIDAWFDSGEAEVPRSARKHSLSDAFAFVGFRSRPNVLQSFPEGESLFPHDHDGRYYTKTESNDRYYTKTETDSLVNATVPVSRGGSGQTGTKASSTVSDIATAASGCEITAAQYASWGKVAMVLLTVKKTAAVSSGTTTLCTLVSGKRPRYNASAQWRWDKGAQITSGGAVQVNGAITAGASITVLSTYVLA